jgi:hypothetical protein
MVLGIVEMSQESEEETLEEDMAMSCGTFSEWWAD